MWYRTRISGYFTSQAFGLCLTGLYPRIAVRWADCQYQSFSKCFKITFVYLSDMRKYSTFYRTSYGFLLWNYPSTIGSRRRRWRASAVVWSYRPGTCDYLSTFHDKRSLYIFCSVLHKQPIWFRETLSRGRRTGQLLLSRPWCLFLVLQPSRTICQEILIIFLCACWSFK